MAVNSCSSSPARYLVLVITSKVRILHSFLPALITIKMRMSVFCGYNATTISCSTTESLLSGLGFFAGCLPFFFFCN